MMTLAVALTVGCAAMAQNGSEKTNGKSVDKTEMVKKRTEAVATRYGLNEDQKAKLLDLNTRYADSMRVGMRPNGGRRTAPAGQPRKIDGAQRTERRGAMKRYNEQLKGIMTAEQYQKYTEDAGKRMQRRGTNRR